MKDSILKNNRIMLSLLKMFFKCTSYSFFLFLLSCAQTNGDSTNDIISNDNVVKEEIEEENYQAELQRQMSGLRQMSKKYQELKNRQEKEVKEWIPSNSSSSSIQKDNTTYNEDYSWIVGTWACNMGVYGTVVVKFDGDGSSGICTEAQYGSYKTGTYSVSGNTLHYKLNGESVSTTIQIEPGHRLSAGGGYYYHKR